MREINLDQPTNVLPRNTFLTYGDSRTGKTTWAASFPRPLFLSDVTEGGWDSIANMDDDQLFEPGVKPLVWGIEEMADMTIARERALPLIAAGRIQTIVVDSLSFYSDLYLNFLVMQQSKKDMRAAYGDLGNHLRDLRVKMHSLNVNVVWLCLARHPDDDVPTGRPMIPGQQGDKFMAGVHYIFHSRVDQQKQGQVLLPPVFEMRTRKFFNYIAGNRLGGRAVDLPDPLVGNYETMIAALGYDADEIRRNLPKIVPIARPGVPVAKPAVAQRPPVITQPVRRPQPPTVKP
ncbi:MAG: AAA family ATPase [Tepidisphaeraceae bacterium]